MGTAHVSLHESFSELRTAPVKRAKGPPKEISHRLLPQALWNPWKSDPYPLVPFLQQALRRILQFCSWAVKVLDPKP